MSIEELHRRFLECTGVCTDSRQLIPGAMFFALKGPNFDANTFASKAIDAGCRSAVVDDPTVARGNAFLLVEDVLAALQQLARFHRGRFDPPVIAITGTNGKTTTKELMHAVLAADSPTLATEGNLNNHIGVPLTLLRMKAEHRSAIIEMGANKPGDIAELCRIADPTHGLITNIGRAHLEGFGDLDGVVRTKTELFEHLRHRGGTVLVNGDDDLLMRRSEGITRHIYGTGNNAEWKGHLTGPAPFLSFDWSGPRSSGSVQTRLVGAYNLPNALAAVAVGSLLGVGDRTIETAISAYTPANNRSQLTDTGRNRLILDAYNANPSSMRAALENFAAMQSDLPKLALLGGMKELGASSAEEHRRLVKLVDDLGIEAILIGPEFAAMDRDRTMFPDASAALAYLLAAPIRGRSILVKGSRGTKLETLVPAL